MTEEQRFQNLLAEAREERKYLWKSVLWSFAEALMILGIVAQLYILTLVFAFT